MSFGGCGLNQNSCFGKESKGLGSLWTCLAAGSDDMKRFYKNVWTVHFVKDDIQGSILYTQGVNFYENKAIQRFRYAALVIWTSSDRVDSSIHQQRLFDGLKAAAIHIKRNKADFLKQHLASEMSCTLHNLVKDRLQHMLRFKKRRDWSRVMRCHMRWVTVPVVPRNVPVPFVKALAVIVLQTTITD